MTRSPGRTAWFVGLAVLVLVAGGVAQAQTVEPTARRLRRLHGVNGGSNPSGFLEVGGTLFAQACVQGYGCELACTGEGGFLKNINPGGLNGNPQGFTNVNGTVFFNATQDGGSELWKSDGTYDGTVRVKEIRPGGTGGSNPSFLTRVGNTLYFAATDAESDTELWKSDGTEAGTVVVMDINPGNNAGVSNLVNVNGTLFFTAMDEGGRELWKSDGTEAGTVRVKDIQPGSGGSVPVNLTNVNGTLYFVTTDDTGADGDVWKSDGTEAGTVRVKDLVPVAIGQWPKTLVAVNSRLFFVFADAAGEELWTSDGTDAGTVRVKDILPGTTGSVPSALAGVNGTLFFAANDGTSGVELWKSDGTESGTVRVRDIHTGASSSSPSELIDAGGILYFAATDAASGRELWKSNGTESGTVLVTDIAPGSLNSNPGSLAVIHGEELVFRANDFVHGAEVWVSGDETMLAFDIEDETSSNPNFFTPANGATFFAANDGVNGNELWKSDGTEAGTVLVKDIFPGGAGSSPTNLVAVGNTLFFTADDGTSGREVWKSDGTAAGTVRVRDVNPGSATSSPTALVDWADANGPRLFFVANDGVHGAELWKSDGTDAGTVSLGGGGALTALRVAGPFLYMAAQPTPTTSGLWRSDGTPAGTILLTAPGGAFTGALDFVTGAAALNGAFYFAANATALGVGSELWKSDGTVAGTVLVKDISVGAGSGSPGFFVRFNNALYFRATDAATGTELWRTDGTAPGTVLVTDAVAGTAGSNPQFLTEAGGAIFYTANEPTVGTELWKTDGTAAGTLRLKEIRPGPIGGLPQLLTNVAGRLFFVAGDGEHGLELWTSDGTAAGTYLVRNIGEDMLFGVFDGAPQNLAASGNTLYFSALSIEGGRQPWTATLVTFTPTPTDSDGDGLPNTWETDFGLDSNSPAGENGPTGDPDSDGNSNGEELEGGGHPRGIYQRYLAEGALNSFFDVRLALLNTGPEAAHVLLRYLQSNGSVLSQVRLLAPLRRRTITREELTGLISPDFSTVLESDQPIVLDRTMSWDASGYGSHAETSIPKPRSTWYLAEGSTSGDFALFYLLQNPNHFGATATVRFLRPFGLPPVEREYELPPNSRTTIPVDAIPELEATDVSGVIEADEYIIVERAMYRSREGQPFAAGHGSAGVTSPALEWFLAEGATGPFFDEFVLIANPNPTPAEVVAEYRLLGGGLLTKNYTIPGNGRYSIWVDAEELPAGSGQKPLANVTVSTTIRSTNGVRVIVERAMWWPGPDMTPNFWYEAHNSPGATSTGTKWALAEGEIGGTSGYDTYILVANTSAAAGQARVTLYFEDGTSAERTYDLAANSRTSVQVGPDFPAAAGRKFGAVVESLGNNPARIVVERAMYSSAAGAVWSAGTNALATKLQ